MGAGNHPAVPIFPCPCIFFLRRRGVDFGKQQGHHPAAHRVAGRVTSFTTEHLLLSRQHLLMETLKRTHAVEIGLGSDPHLVRGGQTVFEKRPDCRGRLRGNFQAERDIELSQQRLVTPNRIPASHLRTHGIESLRLAPHITHDVIGKGCGKRVRGCGKGLDQVRQLFGGEISLRSGLRLQRSNQDHH